MPPLRSFLMTRYRSSTMEAGRRTADVSSYPFSTTSGTPCCVLSSLISSRLDGRASWFGVIGVLLFGEGGDDAAGHQTECLFSFFFVEFVVLDGFGSNGCSELYIGVGEDLCLLADGDTTLLVASGEENDAFGLVDLFEEVLLFGGDGCGVCDGDVIHIFLEVVCDLCAELPTCTESIAGDEDSGLVIDLGHGFCLFVPL